jgi:prevent-host-death family protein
VKNVWQLQEAKNQLSTVVENALTHGAQTITRHGEPVVVVLSASEFKKQQKPKEKLSEFFARSPLKGAKLDLKRIKDYPRDLDL